LKTDSPSSHILFVHIVQSTRVLRRVFPPFSTHSFLLIEKAEIPSWVNIDRFTVILVTPQKAGQNFQFFTSLIIILPYFSFLSTCLCVWWWMCANVCVIMCVWWGQGERKETVLSLRKKNKAWWPFRQTCLPTTRLMKSKLMVSK